MILKLTNNPSPELLNIVSRATELDGNCPVNELGFLALKAERNSYFFQYSQDNNIVGFAIYDPAQLSFQLVVDPAYRGKGIGSELGKAVLKSFPDAKAWAFGNSFAAQQLAKKLNMTLIRELLLMKRDLTTPLSPLASPSVDIITYTPTHAADIVSLNALAFAHHPEQGKLTLDDFLTLTRQSWFEAKGLFIAEDNSSTPAIMAGFHWTKKHSTVEGEVYVICTHPNMEGKGIGQFLLSKGLNYLYEQGCKTVKLYVEASAERAIKMYESASFKITNKDASYQAIKARND